MSQTTIRPVKAIIIIVIALVLAFCSAMAAMGGVLRDGNPHMALRLPFTNGLAHGAMADLELRADLVKTGGVLPEKLDPDLVTAARNGFRAEPTSFRAIRMLAFNLDSTGDSEAARSVMHKLIKITKRDDMVNFWLVQDSAKKEDLDSILKYYDYSLRSSRAVKELLISTMSNALADEGFVDPFTKMLGSEPPWADDFWRVAAARQENALNAATLRSRLHKQKIDNPANNDVLILENLIKDGHFEEAFDLYAVLAGTTKADGNSHVQGGDFVKRPRLYPVEWRLFSSGEFGSEVDLDTDSLLVSSLPNIQATFATQIVHLPAGAYSLSAEAAIQTPAASSPLYLRLRCADAESPRRPDDILRVENGSSRTTIEVAEGGCSYYWLTLLGDELDSLDGYDFAVSEIALARN
ncbi:hypothetical protein [Parasphingorhabdus sp.]|uniref:hypothetical protein n=1 Tax=Parasphingorhabdus sp. TaxID=2709688 RepID=UPI003265BBC1